MRDKLDINNIISMFYIDPKKALLLKLPSYVWAILLGYAIKPIGKYHNIKVDKEGVDYYGEVHKSKFNCYMHTVGMPFTIYGILQWLPALFNLNPKQRQRFIYNLYLIYWSHYMSLDWKTGSLYTLVYTPVTIISSLAYYQENNNVKLVRGIFITCIALLFQEAVGHYYGGDKQSRIEAIPNAILYAKYFSLNHLLKNK